MTRKKISALLLIVFLVTGFFAGFTPAEASESPAVDPGEKAAPLAVCPVDMNSYYHLDEPVAPYLDSMGGPNATCTNCPSATAGIVNSAQLFSGGQIQVDVADVNQFEWTSTDSFSFELWMNSSSTCTGNKVFLGRDDDPPLPGTDLRFWVGCNGSGNVAHFQLKDENRLSATVNISGTTPINDGFWHHIVAVRDEAVNLNRIYVDGVQEGSIFADYTSGFSASTPLNIGHFDGSFKYQGILDEVAIYDRALTSAEIEQHYNSGLVGQDYCTPSPNEPDISVSPAALNFGDVNVGTFGEQVVTLSNVGTAVLNVTGLSTTNPAFTVVSPAAPFAIGAGNNVPVTVRFTPGGVGAANGTLQVSSDDPDEPLVNLSLAGNGVEPGQNGPDISPSATALDFGAVVVGATADQVLMLSNLGGQTLAVTSLNVSNPVFTVVSPAAPFNVAAGGAQEVLLRFAPVAEMAEAGTLQVSSNDPDEPVVAISLSGQGMGTPGLAYRINAGDGAYTATNGDPFVADKAYTAGDYGYSGGKPITTTNPIANTVDDPLYQGQRAGNAFGYRFDNLPAGDYTVTLHFAEIQFSSAGQRRLDVSLEGSLVLDNYDVYAAAGGSNTAITQTFVVPVTDGQLNIDFSTNIYRATIAAIEVEGGTP